MNYFSHMTLVLFCLIFILSCSGQSDHSEPIKQEIPQALQESNNLSRSYDAVSTDLTQQLYQELVEKTPSLKNLENEIDSYQSLRNNAKGKFGFYDNKSSSYYQSANYTATAITDSLLRTKIYSIIKASNKKYSGKTAELNSLLDQISKNGATLNDHHAVLKIMLTIPIIEKFQDENKPNSKEFKDIIKLQEKLIFQTDSLTPKL